MTAAIGKTLIMAQFTLMCLSRCLLLIQDAADYLSHDVMIPAKASCAVPLGRFWSCGVALQPRKVTPRARFGPRAMSLTPIL